MKSLSAFLAFIGVIALVSYDGYRSGHRAGYRQGFDDGEASMVGVAVRRKVARWDVWSQERPERVLVWMTDARWKELPAERED